jgi:hypothetical protein
MLTLQLDDLLVALEPLRRGRQKPLVVSIFYDSATRTLVLEEAKFGRFMKTVPANGEWSGVAQLDGAALARFVAKCPRHVEISVSKSPSDVAINGDGFSARLKRTDAQPENKKTKRPFPRNKQHKGKVEVPADPIRKKVELGDTWAFSARVPVPQHRIPRDEW